MTNQEIFNRLIEGMKTLFAGNGDIDYDSITESTDIVDDLGFDSLKLLMMALLIEREFEIEITDMSIKSFKKVSEVIDYIKERI